LQFAPELRSVVASLLPALFNKLPMGFNGRMTKATLASREPIGFEISRIVFRLKPHWRAISRCDGPSRAFFIARS